MAKRRKISKKEELAYKLLHDQTQGRNQNFCWFPYEWTKINRHHYAFNRYSVSCNSYYLTVDTNLLANSFPEYLDLAVNLNTKLSEMRNVIDEINTLREKYLNSLFTHIKDKDKVHLEYDLLTDGEEKMIAEYQSEPSKITDLLNKIDALSQELDALPKGKANAEKKKELQAQLDEIKDLYNLVKG